MNRVVLYLPKLLKDLLKAWLVRLFVAWADTNGVPIVGVRANTTTFA
jgi:hypothetical protein